MAMEISVKLHPGAGVVELSGMAGVVSVLDFRLNAHHGPTRPHIY